MKSTFSIYDQADSPAADDAGLPRPRPRPEALSAPVVLQPGEQPQERAGRPRDLRGPGRDAPGEDAGRGLPALPAAAARGQRVRLRRPDHDDGAPAAGLPRRGRALPAPVPARAGRRVPGHQPRAVRAGAGARHRRGPRARRTACRAVRRRGRRPVDLRVPRRDDPQHPGLRAGLPGRHHDPARAELPLHPDHPVAANAVISRNASRKPKNLWSDAGRGRADRRLRGRQRARRGLVRRPGGRPALRRGRCAAVRRSRCSTGPTRSPGCSRRCSSGSACPTRWSAGCASTSGARCATRSPTCGCWPTRPTRCRCAGSSTCPSAASATGPRRASRPSRSASRSPSTPRCSGARTPTGWPPGRCRRCRGSGP